MSESANDRIRHRAYLLWEANGAIEGDDLSYWLEAEAEILAEEASADLASEEITPLTEAAPPTQTAPLTEASPAPAKARKAAPRKTTAAKAPRKASATKATGTTKPARSRKTAPQTEPSEG
jgi:hypothetical protein